MAAEKSALAAAPSGGIAAAVAAAAAAAAAVSAVGIGVATWYRGDTCYKNLYCRPDKTYPVLGVGTVVAVGRTDSETAALGLKDHPGVLIGNPLGLETVVVRLAGTSYCRYATAAAHMLCRLN